MVEIVITHRGGAKAGQVERFPLEAGRQLKLGRNPDCHIKFDPEGDDDVSREHAVITVASVEPPVCSLRDLGSSHGTFVGDVRLDKHTTRTLQHGDEIRLAAGGVRIRYDLDPPPAAQAGAAPQTREQVRSRMGTGADAGTSAREPVGKRTVQRMLDDVKAALAGLSAESQKHRKRWLLSLVGVAALLILAAGAYGWATRTSREDLKEVKDKLAQATVQATASPSRTIADRNRSAVVQIEVSWRLYYRRTGQPVFHRVTTSSVIRQGKEVKCKTPEYFQIGSSDTDVTRRLVLDDEKGSNKIVGGIVRGSGIIVNDRGFVLTNKHVAAPYRSNYQIADYEEKSAECPKRGLIYHTIGVRPPEDMEPEDRRSLFTWIPELDDGCLFEPRTPKIIECGRDLFAGVVDKIEIGFPGQRNRVRADLKGFLDTADMALIKIDVPFDLRTVARIGRGKGYDAGDEITIMGYSVESERTYAERFFVESEIPRQRMVEVPEPTVSTGIIANIGKGVRFGQPGESLERIYGTAGDVYQITTDMASDGMSGGPVFDRGGNVIGIFTYARLTPRGDKIKFAVPIRYGDEVMKLQDESR